MSKVKPDQRQDQVQLEPMLSTVDMVSCLPQAHTSGQVAKTAVEEARMDMACEDFHLVSRLMEEYDAHPGESTNSCPFQMPRAIDTTSPFTVPVTFTKLHRTVYIYI